MPVEPYASPDRRREAARAGHRIGVEVRALLKHVGDDAHLRVGQHLAAVGCDADQIDRGVVVGFEL